jgi:hypothetical protein
LLIRGILSLGKDAGRALGDEKETFVHATTTQIRFTILVSSTHMYSLVPFCPLVSSEGFLDVYEDGYVEKRREEKRRGGGREDSRLAHLHFLL